MSRRTTQILLIAVFVIVALGIGFGDDFRTWWDRLREIDACLDHGGSWDHDAGRCDGG